jgi:hypothetical protein
MKYIFKVLTLIVAIALPVFSNATTMNFSYTFSDSRILQGTLDGTVQGDLDTVFINSFGTVNYFSTSFASIESIDFSSVSDFPSGALQPLVSFSGNSMDIIACPNGFSGGNCGFSDASGFYLSNPPGIGVAAGDGLGNSTFESFNAGNWTLTTVPTPAAIWLLGSGLIGLIGMRKKSAKLSGKYA